MIWILCFGALAIWLAARALRSSRRRSEESNSASIDTQQIAPGITVRMGVIRPDPGEWAREREEARKERQAAVERLRAEFAQPASLADAVADMKSSIAAFAEAHACAAPDFDRLAANVQQANTPAKCEAAARKSHNQSYRLRASPAQLADALAFCVLHIQLLLKHREPTWKVATSIKRIVTNLDHANYRTASIGFLMKVGDALRQDRPDVATLCDDEVERLFFRWQADLEATAHFQSGVEQLERVSSASDKHFLLNDLVEYLDRRRRFDPAVRTKLVELCEQDSVLYKAFLTEFHRYAGEGMSFAKAVKLQHYMCPRLPSFDALWELYEEEGNVQQLRRLQAIANEIKYGNFEIDSELETAAPGLRESSSTETFQSEIVEVLKSGQKGKLAFLDSSGTPCSTEEAAQAHFREQGFKTLRGEVQFWQAMFGLVFWEEIFDGTGAPNAYNDIPLDLFSGEKFYEARRAQIEKKAAAIARSNVAEFVAAQLHRHGDTWTRIVFESVRGDFAYRRVLQSAEVCEFLSVIDAGIFTKIVRRIASNPNENRAGLPDYMVWRDKTVVFVEVKGIREAIRDSQVAWLAWMQSEGIPARVLRIKGVRVGAKTASAAD